MRRYVLRTEAQNLSKVSQMHTETRHVHFLRFATLCSAHRNPELVKSIPNASRTKMQVHAFLFRFATLCSAHRSPELVKSIPNASRKNASAFFEICDVMFCAQKPRTCQKFLKLPFLPFPSLRQRGPLSREWSRRAGPGPSGWGLRASGTRPRGPEAPP